jgi:hypothetical protein
MLLANMRVAKLISDAFSEHAVLRCAPARLRFAPLRSLLCSCPRGRAEGLPGALRRAEARPCCRPLEGGCRASAACRGALVTPCGLWAAASQALSLRPAFRLPRTLLSCHPFPNERKMRELQVAAKELGFELDTSSAGGGAMACRPRSFQRGRPAPCVTAHGLTERHLSAGREVGSRWGSHGLSPTILPTWQASAMRDRSRAH